MEINEIKEIIEAILFASGDLVSLSKISEILTLDEKQVRPIMSELIESKLNKQSGIIIKEIENSYQMSTNPEYFDYVRKLFERNTSKTLSQAAYETLAIIAYNKNVTRAKIEAIRGVSAGSTINTLIEKGFVEESGRLEAPGRPVLYRTTDEFLRSFNLRSPADLFPIESFSDEKKEDEEE
ncbi:MAG: SMC-Scp complex subunit ScpB [Clostridia bacterium]|nr:SMC-Scp complex subunit ScpB [Clostridia bacterium]